MAHKPQWKADIEEMMGHERWALTGPLSLVKVTPAEAPVATTQGGYFTTACFIGGLTPPLIEERLGFQPNTFPKGMRIYTFARLPGVSEYTYELTTKFPDGLAYIEGRSDPRYPPGRGVAHQWCLRPGVRIAVAPSRTVVVRPTERYRVAP